MKENKWLGFIFGMSRGFGYLAIMFCGILMTVFRLSGASDWFNAALLMTAILIIVILELPFWLTLDKLQKMRKK